MESQLTNRLLAICGSADKTYGYFDSTVITKLTEDQRTQVEEELIKGLGFTKVVWMDLPAGVTEDGTEGVVAKFKKLADLETPPHEGQVGYVYTITFTPTLYEPWELTKPVKDGCVITPVTQDLETTNPIQSITLSWDPTQEFDRQMLHDKLEKVLDNPEEYKPTGYIGALLRYAAK